MKKCKGQLAAFAAALAAGLCVALTGCETSSSDEVAVTVSPEEATLTAANPSVTLTASGGWNYSWGCDEDYGKLNKYSGSSVVYTAKVFGGGASNIVQRVKVTIQNFTNSTAKVSAEAKITQK